MISLNDFNKKTTEIKLKVDGEEINLVVNLNRLSPACRAKYLNDDINNIVSAIRGMLVDCIISWDIKLNEDDEDFAPITNETVDNMSDSLCIVLQSMIVEKNLSISGELIS